MNCGKVGRTSLILRSYLYYRKYLHMADIVHESYRTLP